MGVYIFFPRIIFKKETMRMKKGLIAHVIAVLLVYIKEPELKVPFLLVNNLPQLINRIAKLYVDIRTIRNKVGKFY